MQGFAPGDHVFVFLGVFSEAIIRGLRVVSQIFQRDDFLKLEAVSQFYELFRGHFFDLMGGVAAFKAFAERPALDGFGENDGRTVGGFRGGTIGGVDLLVVVPASGERAEVVIAEVRNHGSQARVGAEEIIADVVARLGGVSLICAVHGGVHLVEQHAVHIGVEQLVPAGAPDDLDDIPACASEDALQLLDDLAVASHGAVKSLKVAVDNPDEVVQPAAPGQRDGAEGFRFVHFAVAEEAPDAIVAGVFYFAVLEIAVEAGVIDGVEGAEAHRDGGIFPVVGHEARVGVAGETVAADLHAEVVELLFGEAAFQEGAGVGAGGVVALDVNVVAGDAVGFAPEKPVEAHFVERGG